VGWCHGLRGLEMVCHLEEEHGQLKIESRAQDIRSKHEPSAMPSEVQHLSLCMFHRGRGSKPRLWNIQKLGAVPPYVSVVFPSNINTVTLLILQCAMIKGLVLVLLLFIMHSPVRVTRIPQGLLPL